MKKYQILDRRRAWSGFLTVDEYRLDHSRFDGGWHRQVDREILLRGDSVAVLPHDPSTDHVLLVEQFRVGAMAHVDPPWLLELAPVFMLVNDAAVLETASVTASNVSSIRGSVMSSISSNPGSSGSRS